MFGLTTGEARLLLDARRGEGLLLSGTHRVSFQAVASKEEHRRYLSIPMHGCTQAEGCFNAIEPPGGLDTDGTYPDVASGTSFLMAVELGPAGPRARTLLVYSQSANPRSPFHTDQTQRYAAGQWITERYTEAQIAGDPALTVQYLHPPN